jgi:hypothetical protein
MIRVGDGEAVRISVVRLGSEIEQTGEGSLFWRKRSLQGDALPSQGSYGDLSRFWKFVGE